MAEKIKLRISAAVAAVVRPGTGSDEKLAGIEMRAAMSPVDQVTLLFCLMRDTDPVVKEAASDAFSALPVQSLLAFITQPDAHPAILDAITRSHHVATEISAALRGAETLSSQAREFLARAVRPLATPVADRSNAPLGGDEVRDADGMAVEDRAPEDDTDAVDAETEVEEEFLSKYKMSQVMGIGEKIKMALTGDKEWRAILIKDANKLVSSGVVKNPRITEGEILTVLKVGVQNDEIIRLICANKEWIKNYKIRKALVDNPKTPLPNALRYLSSLNEKDIAGYAKSKNVSSVISTAARRILLNKKR